MRDKKNAFLYFFVCVLFSLAASFAHPVTPTFFKDLQVGDYMFGLALAVMMITNFLFSPFWGKMNNYISSRVTLTIGCLGYAVGQAMFGMATGEAGVLFARMFAGVFTGAVFVAQLTYVVNTSDENDRGKYLTISMTITSVGSAFGYFIGGMLGTLSTSYAFIAQSITLALCGGLYFLVCKNDATVDRGSLKLGQIAKEANPFAAFAAGREFLNKSWAKLLLVCGLTYMGYMAFEQVFNYYIKDQFGFSSAYNGIIKAVIGLVALLANSTICMWLIKKTNTKKTVIPVITICTATILGVILSVDPIPFMAISIVFFAFNSVLMPITQNLVAEKADADSSDSNLIMGFYSAIKAVGGIIGPLTAGFIYSAGPKLPFWLAFGGFAVAILFAMAYNSKNDEVSLK